MNLYTVTVQLAGDRNQVITNKGPVSVAEIAVLKAIHGTDAVMDIRLYKHDPDRDPLPEISTGELRELLRTRYHNALPAGNDPIVDKLFGPMGVLPMTLADIGIDAKTEAQRLRAQAEATMAAAVQMEAGEEQTALSEEEQAELQAYIDADPDAHKAATA